MLNLGGGDEISVQGLGKKLELTKRGLINRNQDTEIKPSY